MADAPKSPANNDGDPEYSASDDIDKVHVMLLPAGRLWFTPPIRCFD